MYPDAPGYASKSRRTNWLTQSNARLSVPPRALQVGKKRQERFRNQLVLASMQRFHHLRLLSLREWYSNAKQELVIAEKGSETTLVLL
jgi:hypothetical protein